MADITNIESGIHAKESYMQYAMSTILDRALPDVRDGFKPVHRRILYSMYESKITYNEDMAKTTEPVAETMKIHHHGDTSISEAIALMTEQNESLLHPYIDGEGTFGKVYLKCKPSAARYTYCRLNKFSEEFFKDIKSGIIQLIGEDKKHLQPVVLSASFPNILIKNNEGIACGVACNFPSFNLSEVCDTTIAYIKDKEINLLDTLKAMDFSSGEELIYNENELNKIYTTGRGSILLRSKYIYDEKNNCIDIYKIPYSTTADAIISKITELMKNDSSLKDILDIRDETGFNKKTQKEELKITIDVKKNTNISLLMKKLFKKTPLQSCFSANMNCLVDFKPKVLGIKQILDEWLKFRTECITKGLKYNIDNLSDKLYILKGLESVLLNVDNVIDIVKNSKTDDIIISKLMSSLNISKEQAEYIADIKLRNINKNYILNKIKDIEILEQNINDLKYQHDNKDEINKIIVNELERIKKTYGIPRKTEIVYDDVMENVSEDVLIEDYNIRYYLTNDGYLKKIPLTSLRGTSEHKLKEKDFIISEIDSINKSDLILLSDKGIAYKLKSHELPDTKISNQGEYLPNIINLDKDEKIIYMISTTNYSGYLLIAFKNGKITKIDLSSYATKTNRSKLINAYSTDSEIVNMLHLEKDIDLLCKSSINKVLIINTEQIAVKSSKMSVGVSVMKSKNESYMDLCVPVDWIDVEGFSGLDGIEYYKGNINSIGNYLRKGDSVNVAVK